MYSILSLLTTLLGKQVNWNLESLSYWTDQNELR